MIEKLLVDSRLQFGVLMRALLSMFDPSPILSIGALKRRIASLASP
jgi:hypothetical protein